MPPTPSVTAWCTFIASAAPSPSSPSNKVNSHSGRARSNAARRDRLQRVEQRSAVAGRGESHAAEVEVEVERFFDDPPRRSEAERR